MKRITMILAVNAIFIISARGQSFQNLNFESAQDLPGNPGNNGTSVSVANALPDWTVYDGSLALSYVYYVSNNFLGDTTAVELEGGSLALSGNFSVGLYFDASISQTGLVPNNAESLQFEASSALNLQVILDGQSLPYSAISQGPDYTMYGANIPAGLEGQPETLTFETISGETRLDDIEFLPTSVPEPSEYALIGLGAILFGIYRCKGVLYYTRRLVENCSVICEMRRLSARMREESVRAVACKKGVASAGASRTRR